MITLACMSNELMLTTSLAPLKNIGIQAMAVDHGWNTFEPSPGVFDWSLFDNAESICREAELVYMPQIAFQYTPDWLFTLDPALGWYSADGQRLDSSLNGVPPNWFHPQQFTYVERAVKAAAQRLAKSKPPIIILSIGQWGECYYPGDGNKIWAFDPNTLAAWAQYVGSPDILPPTTYSDPSPWRETFLQFWYQGMYEYIKRLCTLFKQEMPWATFVLKNAYNPGMGQQADQLLQAALSSGARIINSFGLATMGQEVSEFHVALSHQFGVPAWNEGNWVDLDLDLPTASYRLLRIAPDVYNYGGIWDLMDSQGRLLDRFFQLLNLLQTDWGHAQQRHVVMRSNYFPGWKTVVRTDGMVENYAITFDNPEECPYTFPPVSQNFWGAYNSTLVEIVTGVDLTIQGVRTNENPTPPLVGVWWKTGFTGMGWEGLNPPATLPVSVPAMQKIMIQLNEQSSGVILETKELGTVSLPLGQDTLLIPTAPSGNNLVPLMVVAGAVTLALSLATKKPLFLLVPGPP